MPAPRTVENRHDEAQYLAAVKDFEAAVRYFQKEKFDKSKEIFERLLSSPAREVAARARIHLQLCNQKLSSTERAAAPKTAEDYYNLGVVDLNARSSDLAIEHLSKADKLAPSQEHICYALAAAHAVRGNTDAAFERLSAAIALRRSNRIRARGDDDFAALATDPRFKELIGTT